MASSFDNNLRLAEMATGDQPGTWGTQTNTNLSLITDAFKYGSEAIANASTATITMQNATADDARSFYLKCTGGGQACTVTLAPNTVSKVWIIENATSYTLTFSQGSGANVSILAGQVKAIATDGGGSSAAVYDLFTDLHVTDSLQVGGSTPTLTIGDGDAEDAKILFDGNAQDFYIGLDDSADDLVIGKGSTVGTTPAISVDENSNVTFAGDITISDDALTMGTNTSGHILVADGTNYNPVAMSGDVAIASNGATTIQANSVALGTDTTGNYVATVAGTTNEIEVSGSGSETAAVTVGLPNAVTVTTSVTSASFFYSSDAALKEDIQTIEKPLEKVQALRGVSYKWKDTGRKDIGLVADEVEKVLPELVVEDKHKTMDYGHMIGLLVEAIKEQQKEIEELKCQK
tara:strand:+ start:170 stop:1384 length:1215 start_codon:yes stop_codon:yes gene_type:complete